MVVKSKSGNTYRIERSMLEVTSMSRPDTDWKVLDAHGHEHRWYVESGGPDGHHISASRYSPQHRYITPTLNWIHERFAYYEDGSRYSIGHYACAQCGERIENPRTKADDCEQYVPGLARYYVNDRSVQPEEFKRLVEGDGFTWPS